MSDTHSPAVPANGRRRGALIALGGAVLIGAAIWGGYVFFFQRGIVSTDDAYVSGDVVQVTSEIPGTVLGLHVDDTQIVRSGQPLLELDPADAQVAMASAEAGLAQAVRRVHALFAQADGLRAQIVERQALLKQAQDDYKRRAGLIASGAISSENFAHAQDSTAVQTAGLAAAQAQLEQTLAAIGGTSVAGHPDVLSAAARLRDAALSLHRTHLVAPVDGLVAKRSVQVGQHVDPATPLMAIVPLENVWVEANFKERQLERMRIGQPVTAHADLYGSDVTYHGKVAGLSAGSGNVFSLLPPQNATGNWIKVVQRVPVRILLDPAELKDHPLRIGLSVVVDIDVESNSGSPATTPVRNQPLPSRTSDGVDPAIDSLILKIIDENGGGTRSAQAGN